MCGDAGAHQPYLILGLINPAGKPEHQVRHPRLASLSLYIFQFKIIHDFSLYYYCYSPVPPSPLLLFPKYTLHSISTTMSLQPQVPAPAHTQLESTLSRRFGKETVNYFSSKDPLFL